MEENLPLLSLENADQASSGCFGKEGTQQGWQEMAQQGATSACSPVGEEPCGVCDGWIHGTLTFCSPWRRTPFWSFPRCQQAALCLACVSQPQPNAQLTEKKAGAGGRAICCCAERSPLYFLFHVKGFSAGCQGWRVNTCMLWEAVCSQILRRTAWHGGLLQQAGFSSRI